MVNAVNHAAAVGIRRLESVKIEVVQRLVRELELEEHLLARAHVLVVRRICSVAVRRRRHLIDIEIVEMVVRAVCDLALVNMTGFPSRRIFRRAVLDEGIAVIRLVQVFEFQIEIRTRDLERRDLAVARHRVTCRIIALERVLLAVGEIVVRCIRARELDTRIVDVVLLILFCPRRILRLVFTRIDVGGDGVDLDIILYRRETVIPLLIIAVKEMQSVIRGIYAADLDIRRVVEYFRDRIGLEPQRTAVDRVRMRRQRRMAILILQFIVIEER